MDKRKYYEELKKTIASDGKTHQSTITENGIIIDGKLYMEPTPIIRDDKSHQGIRTKSGEQYGEYKRIRQTIPQNPPKR